MKVYWCEGVLCEGVPVGLEGYTDMSCTGGGGGGGNVAIETYPGPDLPFTAMTSLHLDPVNTVLKHEFRVRPHSFRVQS